MRTTSLLGRILALTLVLCTVLGLLPAGAMGEALAAEGAKADTRATTEEANTLAGTLTTKLNSLVIPVNDEVTNYTSLDGVFFLKEAGSGRIIDFSKGRSDEHTDRLTANSNSGTAAGGYYHLSSVAATGANGGAVTAINGSTPTTLDYAVEIKKYTGTITRDTTTKTTVDDTTYTGWAGYIKYEYNRSNSWSGDKKFGEYLGIASIPSTSDPVYSIKSLHPNRASAPYLACNTGSGNMNYASGAYPFFLKVNSTNASVKLYKLDYTGKTKYTYWLGVDTAHSNCVSGHTISQIVREDRNKSTADKFANCNKKAFKFEYWDVFQVSPVALELYKTLLKAKTYVTGKNADGVYPAETYYNFLKFVESALATYNSKRTVWNVSKTNADRVLCDQVAKDLQSYMALLDIESKPNSYMDIPMEVLDFRADGLLFENCGGTNPFALGSGIPTISSATAVPGTPAMGENDVPYRAGLTEPQLVNGQIVYKEETVRYVAEALFLQYLTLSDPNATNTKDSYDTYWNSVFMQLVDPEGMKGNKRANSAAVNSYPLGANGYDHEANYDATIAKTSTKSNGGILRFEQVENCYDLAYYMLTNVWRETAKDDYVDTGRQLPYNLRISELQTMRMLKDSSGYYVYSSDKENGRCLDSKLIFNHNLTKSSSGNVPAMNAAAGLGFESSSMFGNDSTGVKETNSATSGVRNYHVMYHMRSAFIYYENKELEFEFTGDDDVYFFINNTLVCDIGGMHAACTRTIELNGQIAQDLGLEDGDICTFDMFLAERHTSQINLNLRTNIEMMPAGAVTDKVQYEYTQAGVIGPDIREGAVVADNAKVGYGFKLLNRHEHGATDLTFVDEDLGVTLTGSEVTLGEAANAEDLIFIYRTYDAQSNAVHDGEPVAQTYTDFFNTLDIAMKTMDSAIPLAEGAYSLTGLTADQIMALMTLGIPANAQISVYGFHRTVSAKVGGYTNTVRTTCRPISARNTDGSFAYGESVSGYAIRNLSVQSMNLVTAEPMDIVIDYGKPVTFTIEDLLKTVTYDPQDVTVSYEAVLPAGTHGKILFKLPEGLALKGEGDTLTTDNGVYDYAFGTLTDNGGYDHSFGSIRFTPKGMLETVERIYALICVNDVYLGSVWYLTVEIRIIPASIMYYEAESLADAGDLTFTEKYTEEATEAPSEEATESTEDATEPSEDATEPSEDIPEEDVTEPEDDGVRINNNADRREDTEDREHPVSTYSPIGDPKVLFFDFNTYADNDNPYTGNSVYGGVNFGNVANWWSPGYGAINSMTGGEIKFTTTNNDNPWGYIASGAPSSVSSETYTANAASFPLKYSPSPDDWCEIRLKVDKTAAQEATNTHLRIEFFPFSGDTALARAAVSTKNFPASNINNGYFVLKFPLTTMDNTDSPCGIEYSELALIRRINFLIRGMDKSETFTTYFDYIYIGPEETCPSSLHQDSIYIGFDNSPADRYRYTNPMYGSRFNYDRAPAATGDGWIYTDTRSPALSVTPDGVMRITAGTIGGTDSNSPYIQTGYSGSEQNVMDYPIARAEEARVKLKFENMTTALTDTQEYMDERQYPEYPVIRLGFVLDDDATYETSSCWVDWPVTEEQLNGCDYMTLTGDIATLLAEHEAKKISAIRLTIVSAAGMEGQTGYVYVDEIYVGPKTSQDPDIYIAPTETKIPATPELEAQTLTYDSSVLYFGFGNTDADQTRYSTNPVYTGKNFDTNTNWKGTADRTVSVSDGALHLSGSTGSKSYVVFNTGTSTSDFDHLNYRTGSNDWFEVRIKINDPSVLLDPNTIRFDLELYRNNPQMYKINHVATVESEGGVQSNRYYTITFKLPEESGDWANTIPYSDVGTVKRFAFNPVGLYTNKTYSCSIDYIYIGPEEKLPSKEKSDFLYFGFDNDKAAQNRYGSTVYGGDNFDTAEKWRYNTDRSSAPTISGGTMTYTIKSKGDPWFETSRNGIGTGPYMHFDPSNAEIVRIRVKFNNIEMMGSATGSTMTVFFGNLTGTTTNEEPVQYKKEYFINEADISTDGKWFTYTVYLEDQLKNVTRVTGMRINFSSVNSSNNSGTITFDYIYVGPDLDKAPEEYRRDEVYTYGWDSTYTLDRLYSDYESLYTEGRGVVTSKSDGTLNYEGAKAYTEFGFSFKGTGFDLISRTGAQQATIRVSVYEGTETTGDNCVKTLTVNNKGELELYQIPVVSVHGLTYGRYTVRIWVNDKVTADSLPQIPGVDLTGLTRGNAFYLDAVRIYDPIEFTSDIVTEERTIASQAYRTDKEAYQYITELRNLLLNKEDYADLKGTLPGALFLDKNSSFVDPETGTTSQPGEGYTTVDVETYNKVGPKNEIYLAPGQAIAFRLAVDTTEPIDSLDIGVKTLGLAGEEALLEVGYVTAVNGTEFTVDAAKNLKATLHSATSQYYAVDEKGLTFLTHGASDVVYFVVYNKSQGSETSKVISVTDIKIAYETDPDIHLPSDSYTDPEIQTRMWKQEESPVRLLVDCNAVQAAAAFIQAAWETPAEDEELPTEPGEEELPDDSDCDVAEGINIRHSLNLASDISINYLVAKTELEGYENTTMVCTLPQYEGNELVGRREIVIEPELRGEYYYFTLTGLTAVHMMDEVGASLFMTKEGRSYTTLTDTYSIAQYAYGQLAKAEAADMLKALCAELLRYGGAAQTFKGYRTDSLADSAMTDSHRAYLSDLEAVTFGNTNAVLEDLENATVTWAGKVLSLESKVALKFVFRSVDHDGELADLRLRVSYTDTYGELKTLTVEDPELYNEAMGYYAFTVDSLLASELRSVVSVQIYEGDTPVSCTLRYSPDTYGNGKTGTLLELCKALFAYSDSAKAFFTP